MYQWHRVRHLVAREARDFRIAIIKQDVSSNRTALTLVLPRPLYIQPPACLPRMVMPDRYYRRGFSGISLLVGRETEFAGLDFDGLLCANLQF